MTVLFIPVQLRVAKEFSVKRRQVAGLTDKRVRYMSESIHGIASVKSFGWETPFFSLLSAIRDMEMKTIGQALDLKAINYALYFCSPHVASFATFMVFINTGGTLTLPIIYTTLSLLQILRLVIGRMWTRAIETFSECLSSCQRIEKFLDTAERVAKELKSRSQGAIADANNSGGKDGEDDGSGVELSSTPGSGRTRQQPSSSDAEAPPVLSLPCPCSFTYGATSVASRPVISNVHFSVYAGEVVMVVGPVGAGKSSLLASILGDLTPSCAGTGPVADMDSVVYYPLLGNKTRVAYCAQRPWIIASTVRANITLAGRKICNAEAGSALESEIENFKKPTFVDTALYNDAIKLCKLKADLGLWPAGDDTEIGERGVSVSGGQKARLSLARAVYADADCK
jgi:ATP-binding cassette, subfamily C (CFTR/MRP), member 4